IVKPIYHIVSIIVIFAMILIVIIIFISVFFSKTITNPVKDLALASQTITGGDYNISIDTQTFTGELLDLGESFNKMTKEINIYREHLEELVKNRTQKLSEANKKMKDDLMMAQRIQESLIPKVFPKNDILKMSGLYIPMENLGGDLYDVIKLSESKIAIMILDVCGHGVAAALITTMAKALFNSYSVQGLTCKEVVTNVNRELRNIIGDMGNYLTAFYGIIDLNTQILEYTNAAHTISYVLKKDGSIVEMDTNSTLIGVFENIEFDSSYIKLNEFDKIILYTDGIPESRDASNNLFGYDRFKELLLSNRDLNLKEFVKQIIDNVKDYRKDEPQEDDITLLI
ncbi:MAG TPA: SpoIIE family protein phosphatase, partial [Spirochaetota bacterium]|nr:SpoIIE family protein phosphatase [Spirochaetota bacterium]